MPPHFALQGLSDLTTENEDGITVMQWLRSAYPHDWHNLLERLKKGHKELFRSFVDDRYSNCSLIYGN